MGSHLKASLAFFAGGAVVKHRSCAVSQRAHQQSLQYGQHRALLEDLQQVNMPTWHIKVLTHVQQTKNNMFVCFPRSRRDLNIDRNSTFK